MNADTHTRTLTTITNEDSVEYYAISQLTKLPRGSYFRKLRNGVPYGDVMTKQGYCRSERKFECYYESDISKNAYLNGRTQVAVGFILIKTHTHTHTLPL